MSGNTIHDRIRERRLHLGLSLEKLAEELSVSYQTVQQWENGRSGPKRTRMGQLARLLGVTEQFLLTGSDPNMGDLLENQALTLIRGLPLNVQEIAVQQLQALYTAVNIGKYDRGSPFGDKKPPPAKK